MTQANKWTSAQTEGDELRFSWNVGSETKVLDIANLGQDIEQIRFAGGLTVDSVLIDDGSDTRIEGNTGNNLIVKSNDEFRYLDGGSGNDAYLINADSGSSWISRWEENTGEGNDRVVFSGIELSDLSFDMRKDSENGTSENGSSARISWDTPDGAGSLELADRGDHVETFEFGPNKVVSNIVVDNGTATTVNGSSDSDLIVKSNDEFRYLDGGAGDDIYLITADSGNSWITRLHEFTDEGTDQIVFRDINFSDVTITYLSDAENGTSENGTSIRIEWVVDGHSGVLELADGGAHIETYEFADGTIMTADEFLI